MCVPLHRIGGPDVGEGGGLPFTGAGDAVRGNAAAFVEAGSDGLAVNSDAPDPTGTPGRTRAFGPTMA